MANEQKIQKRDRINLGDHVKLCDLPGGESHVMKVIGITKYADGGVNCICRWIESGVAKDQEYSVRWLEKV